MNQQLSLFENEFEAINERLEFYGHYCNDDWSVKTDTVDGVPDIVDWEFIALTKNELVSICNKAKSAKKAGPYSYKVRFMQDGVKKELFVRFGNYSAREKWSVLEFIELYFDVEVRK